MVLDANVKAATYRRWWAQVSALEVLVQSESGALGHAVQVLATERSAAQGAPRQKANVVVAGGAGLRQLRGKRTPQEAKGVLDAHGSGGAHLICGLDPLSHAVRGLVAEA